MPEITAKNTVKTLFLLDTLFDRDYILVVIREFIITKEFDRRWKAFGLDDDDLSELEIFLCKNPNAGDVMEGTGGIKKIRWALGAKGKRGGVRIIYLDIVFAEHIYLITAFSKNEKDFIDNSIIFFLYALSCI